MNMELIRKQLEGIETPEVNLTHHDILNEIRARKNRRRSNLRIVAIVAVLFIAVGTTQYQQISAFAGSLYRNITFSLNNDTLVIENLGTIPIEIGELNWLGNRNEKREGTRVGSKAYADINALEEELGISILRNSISIDMSRHSRIPFVYFEKTNIVELIFQRHFIGDLKDYKETIEENGDLSYSYKTDGSVYKSPLDMSVSFLTGNGENLENNSWEFFDYEEKYTSPINGITAYLMKYGGSITLGEEEIELRLAAGEADSVIVFVDDNLLYTIAGNVPSDDMKRIVDGFIISE
jgi:hypothetical protein